MPGTPSEPDQEVVERTPCRPIPLDDDQGSANVKDHSAGGWPEPQDLPPPMAGTFPMPGPPGLMPGPPGMLPLPPNNWVRPAVRDSRLRSCLWSYHGLVIFVLHVKSGRDEKLFLCDLPGDP